MSIVQDLRHRGSKGGGSIDMEAQESRPLLGPCPEPVSYGMSISDLFEPHEPFKVQVSLVSPIPRRLVVMFDGTSNMRNSLTNVSRFFEAIDDSSLDDYKLVNPDERILESKDCSEVQPVPCSTCQCHEKAPGPHLLGKLPTKGPDDVCPDCKKSLLKRSQLVHYVRGVGSKWYDGFGSLAFGAGLSGNVKKGYKWLVNNYRDGDEIFVFGFSRGAFSARSLVSLLHRCGGLPVPIGGSPVPSGALPVPKTREEKAAINGIVDDAYAMYQAFDPKHPSKPAYLQKGKNLYESINGSGKRMQRVTVAMLGVWDTVGAVGLRSIRFLDTLYYHFSSRHYAFHDQDLPCIVEHAYHALAIDERRFHFAPTLWTVPRPDPDSKIKVDEVPSLPNLERVANPHQMANTKKIPLREVKQVWFMGSHCNVGGGADLDDVFDPDDLWQYSYVWMQKHAEKLGLRFYWTFETPTKKKGPSSKKLTRFISQRQPERSYENFLWPGWYRYLRLPFYRHVTASINTGATKVHWSVVERIKVDGVKLEEERKAKAAKAAEADKAVKRKPDTCIARLKNTLCFWKETEDEVQKFEPYRPESLFKERDPTPTIRSPREWIWSKLTLLLCTLGFSKSVEDDSKLEVAGDGKITVSGKWKNLWPWVEFDDLKTVAEMKDKEKIHAAPTLPVAELNSCNCHSELETKFDKVEDTRWLLRKVWDCWVNWWPL